MLSWQQIAMLIAAWFLLATTYLCYRSLQRRFGAKRAYFSGFLFYCFGWCILSRLPFASRKLDPSPISWHILFQVRQIQAAASGSGS